jgi:putative membrane protein
VGQIRPFADSAKLYFRRFTRTSQSKEYIVLSSLATIAPAFHGGVGFLLPLFFIGHAFGVLVIILIIVFAIGGRRRRWARWNAMGQGGFGHWGGSASRAAETTLAERFAQGDIDEKEYRARLEVLRANNAMPHPGAK